MFSSKKRGAVLLHSLFVLNIVRASKKEEKLIQLDVATRKPPRDIIYDEYNPDNPDDGYDPAKPPRAFAEPGKKWDYGKVRYHIDNSIGGTDPELIRKVMSKLGKVANCLDLVEVEKLPIPGDYIKFTRYGDADNDGGGCWSYVGNQAIGEQVVNLPQECMVENLVTHEVLHALGFHHEQNRHDRDEYVKIVWSNIPIGFRSNFRKRPNATEYMSYDYHSIMHYNFTDFTNKPGENTIEPLNQYIKDSTDTPSRGEMTGTDMMALNRLYGCETVSDTVMMKFLSEENNRVNVELKQLKETIRNKSSSSSRSSTELNELKKELREEIMQELREEIQQLKTNQSKFKEEIKKLTESDGSLSERLGRVKTSLELNTSRITHEVEHLKEEDSRFNNKIENMKEDLEKTVQAGVQSNLLKDQPFAYQCGFQNNWSDSWADISFDRLTFSSMSDGVTGGLDRDTGVFTAGHSGVWTVSYSVRTRTETGQGNYVWLYKNGSRVKESRLSTYYRDQGDGSIETLGARTIYLQLIKGDTVSLKTNTISKLEDITLCFELAHST